MLLLESGPDTAWDYESYSNLHLETFFTASTKSVESPWPAPWEPRSRTPRT